MRSSGPIDERGVRFLWSWSDNLFASSRILTWRRLAVVSKTIRNIFGAEERLFSDFGQDETVDKSLNVRRFSRRVLRLLHLTEAPFQQPVDLGCIAGSVMDLGFHGSYFCRSLGDIVVKITDIRRLASRFPSLSAFAASELGLLFSQLFLFVPIENFLLFCHRFVEQRAYPSRSASGPPWMSVDVLIGIVGDITRIQGDALDFVIL
ncbi:hypothetical protein F2Q69_00016745 [Brassica cretica]|uniref:Uncharacterized protein n=1 Tax=Brassica cretica TaxID=69181 RepID=A0A8S9QUX6_BRACR|nr:hypothetical protein F2Q69_00016745 [Brassica cretica]